MKTFCTLGAFAAVLVSTSARYMAPEDVDRNVAEARNQRQEQCGRLPLGSLEYNQCMADWTNRVVDSYPEDQHLIPRQEAERMKEADRAESYRNEVNRLAEPETEHYVVGGNPNQRVAIRRHMPSSERMSPANFDSGMDTPEEYANALPVQHQQPEKAPMGRIVRTTLSGKRVVATQAKIPAAAAANMPAVAPTAEAAPAAAAIAKPIAGPANIAVQKIAQPLASDQAQEESDDEDESDAPAVAQPVVKPNFVGTAAAAPATALAAVAQTPASSNDTAQAVLETVAKQITAAASSVASANSQEASVAADAETPAVDAAEPATNVIENAESAAATTQAPAAQTSATANDMAEQPSLAAIVAAQNKIPQLARVKVVTQVAQSTAAPTIINAVHSIQMTTIGNAVVPFDVNVFGPNGASFAGLASKDAAESTAAALEALVDAAAETSAEVVAESSTNAAVETSAAKASAAVVATTPAAAVADASVLTSNSAKAATVTARVSPASPVMSQESTSPVLARAATEFKLRLPESQSTATVANTVNNSEATSKIVQAGMKNKVDTNASAKMAVSSMVLIIPAIANILF
ncbi:hypothetical protein IWW50_001626 [Coemansia erecta]|nr:hypothetical protein IWW50_001626 [Coemansia erecta]